MPKEKHLSMVLVMVQEVAEVEVARCRNWLLPGSKFRWR
jgi:hypothetical protein